MQPTCNRISEHARSQGRYRRKMLNFPSCLKGVQSTLPRPARLYPLKMLTSWSGTVWGILGEKR